YLVAVHVRGFGPRRVARTTASAGAQATSAATTATVVAAPTATAGTVAIPADPAIAEGAGGPISVATEAARAAGVVVPPLPGTAHWHSHPEQVPELPIVPLPFPPAPSEQHSEPPPPPATTTRFTRSAPPRRMSVAPPPPPAGALWSTWSMPP